MTPAKERKLLWIWLPVISAYVLVAILLMPALFTSSSPGVWKTFDSNSGSIADTINGISAPFIAILAAILTFFAFWVQYKANQEQRRDISVERFESMFFEMIRFHRDNVNIINSRDQTSRNDLFITMFFELRFIYNLSLNLFQSKYKKVNPSHTKVQEDAYREIEKEEIYKIAYIVFFSGANPDTESTLIAFFSDSSFQQQFFIDLINYLKSIRSQYRALKRHAKFPFSELNEKKEYAYTAGGGLTEDKVSEQLYYYTNSNDHFALGTLNWEDVNRPIIFWILKEPFEGHTNELGHYFRHLFQTVQYLNAHQGIFEENIAKPNGDRPIPQKLWDYFKMLRAQLSNYEMLLLYYHALSTFGEEWLDPAKEALLVKYKVLKKMPLTYADFYIKPTEKIPEKANGPHMFDWHMHKHNMSNLNLKKVN